MRHVAVMTAAGSIGLMFAFIVDFATLFWVGQAGGEPWVAAAGYAFTLQFFAVSVGVGLMIAGVAMISREMGRDEFQIARRMVSVSTVIAVLAQTVIAAGVVVFRYPMLELLGAKGAVLDDAARYIFISMPSLPVMAIGLMGSAALRAEGDAKRSMFLTLLSGLLMMFVDPLLVIGLGLGLDGAAIGVCIFRLMFMALAIRYVIFVHDLAAPLSWEDIRVFAKPFLLIAAPAVLTQLSTPAGNAIVTAVISQFGDSAVAGWTVVSRVSVVAFGGIFALSGAIGGIIGQNYGAGLMDRVSRTFRDALLFCGVYVVIAWIILYALTGPLVVGFDLRNEGVDVLKAFTHIGALGFVFTGALFVANAAFNALDRAVWATFANWTRDGIVMYPICLLGAYLMADIGVIYAQAVANVIVGAVAAYLGWRYVQSLLAPADRIESGGLTDRTVMLSSDCEQKRT